MLFLVVSLICWTLTEGGCSGTTVSISVGQPDTEEGFILSCDFTCLRPQHFAQLWKESRHGGVLPPVPLLNRTSTFPYLTLALSIRSSTTEDTGNYSCKTQPPDAISPSVSITVTNNLTTPSPLLRDSSSQSCSAVGLQSQIWFWILMGKAALFLPCWALLAVKYKKG